MCGKTCWTDIMAHGFIPISLGNALNTSRWISISVFFHFSQFSIDTEYGITQPHKKVSNNRKRREKKYARSKIKSHLISRQEEKSQQLRLLLVLGASFHFTVSTPYRSTLDNVTKKTSSKFTIADYNLVTLGFFFFFFFYFIRNVEVCRYHNRQINWQLW